MTDSRGSGVDRSLGVRSHGVRPKVRSVRRIDHMNGQRRSRGDLIGLRSSTKEVGYRRIRPLRSEEKGSVRRSEEV